MIDLHTHSTASDGSLTPTELVAEACKAGLSWLALTDHNTIHGLHEFQAAAAECPLHAIAGIEFSTELDGEELHILALNLPGRYWQQVDQLMEEFLRKKTESNLDLIENLRKGGYALCYEEIRRANPDSFLNRAHIAQAMVTAGYAADVTDAFLRFLRRDKGFYHPPERLSALDVIPLIRDLQAVPVWAHPLFKLDAGAAQRVLERIVPSGLAAMETDYAAYTPQQTGDALALAERFGLKRSGGSDFHGSAKPDIHLGTGRGNLNIPDHIAHLLFE